MGKTERERAKIGKRTDFEREREKKEMEREQRYGGDRFRDRQRRELFSKQK
jgi:hypothetical protein